MANSKKLTAHGEDLLDDGSNYDKNAYPKAANTVDICICRFYNDELQVLLIKRKHNPFKENYAIPGGYVDIHSDETLEDSALRELEEETGISGIPVFQLKTYGAPDRDPRDRTISTAYYALVNNSLIDKQVIEAKDDAMSYKWFSLRELPEQLAFDHGNILNDLLAKLQKVLLYTEDIFYLMEKEFSMGDLQKLFEDISGKEIDEFEVKINSIFNLHPISDSNNVKSDNISEKKYSFVSVKNIFK